MSEKAKLTIIHPDDDVLTMMAKLAYKSDRDGVLHPDIIHRVEHGPECQCNKTVDNND